MTPLVSALLFIAIVASAVTGFSQKNGNSAATRRDFFASIAAASILTASSPSRAAPTTDAAITDKIFIEFKGLSASGEKDRIVIGLFGNDAPQPVSILKQLVSKEGYKSKCKPLDTSRLLQKDQLEANKVYNSCLENEDTYGVNYDYSSVWRVLPNQRIDVGAVTGKFVARENPNFEDTKLNTLKHDSPGVVSVRRGNDGGYGFTLYPGGDESILNEDNIVVGRVIEGLDVVQKLNEIPIVKSAGVNYMALTGGPNAKNAPSRACRYGGPMYCNENKPLKKVLIERTGIL
ncbi:hypothetical protein ACHAWO_000979 [Cyclotella atomus]|uniref:PPIase cyclophilin-type domain-containing protein n=1 Tax=Cyclotella atomus TaxID=382360 RepID=A0ABD3PW18_9STRA